MTGTYWGNWRECWLILRCRNDKYDKGTGWIQRYWSNLWFQSQAGKNQRWSKMIKVCFSQCSLKSSRGTSLAEGKRSRRTCLKSSWNSYLDKIQTKRWCAKCEINRRIAHSSLALGKTVETCGTRNPNETLNIINTNHVPLKWMSQCSNPEEVAEIEHRRCSDRSAWTASRPLAMNQRNPTPKWRAPHTMPKETKELPDAGLLETTLKPSICS